MMVKRHLLILTCLIFVAATPVQAEEWLTGFWPCFAVGNVPAPVDPDVTLSQEELHEFLNATSDIVIEVREYNTCDGEPLPSGQLACWVTFEQYGHQKTIWRANYQRDYCYPLAKEMSEKLVKKGYTCWAADAQNPCESDPPTDQPAVEPAIPVEPSEGQAPTDQVQDSELVRRDNIYTFISQYIPDRYAFPIAELLAPDFFLKGHTVTPLSPGGGEGYEFDRSQAYRFDVSDWHSVAIYSSLWWSGTHEFFNYFVFRESEDDVKPFFLGVISGGVLISGSEEGLVFETFTGGRSMTECPPEKITRGIPLAVLSESKEFHAANGFILKSEPYTCELE
jgi:hypothetical protein